MQIVTQKLVPPSLFPTLPHAKAGKYAYILGVSICPSMDLVATYPELRHTGEELTTQDDADDDSRDKEETAASGYDENDDETINVDVWRFNGQRVFTIAVETEDGGKVEVRGVQWRSDGQILAILSNDNMIRLVNSFSGKIVHRFSSISTYAPPSSPISPRTRRSVAKLAAANRRLTPTVLSYSAHFANPDSTQNLLNAADIDSSLVVDDLLSLNADINSLLKSPADLPRELANIDVESFLPRLSCLPPMGFGSEDVFSTRTSIDAIFHSSKRTIQSGTVDVLTTCNSDGTASVRIFDSFELGGIDLNSATGQGKTSTLGRAIYMTSRPFDTKVFVATNDLRTTGLHLLELDMRFITNSSNTLPILATKATQLQNLLRYLSQIQNQLAREVKTAFDLPTRYLRNVNEDLEKQDGAGASFATAAYHTIVTGEIYGAFKEWLNEQLGERGVKRWEKSVGDCLELVRRLVSEAWCPALERAGVVVSRLNGLASWTARSDLEGPGLILNSKVLGALRDTIDVMAIRGEECLRDVIKEASGFACFIKWLKWEVEASMLEDTSERLDEMREGSEHGDIMKILEYIEGGPQESVVKSYLISTSTTATTGHEDDTNFHANFKEQRRRSGIKAQMPTFDHLLTRMRKQCDALFEQIAQNLRQEIMTRHIVQPSVELDQDSFDMRVIQHQVSGHVHIHMIALRKNEEVSMVHQKVIANGAKNTSKAGPVQTLQPPNCVKILDIKFVDDEHFMLLVQSSNDIRIYSHHVEYDSVDEWELRHCFEEGVMESGMKPARLEINGRKNRRVVGVIDGEGKGYVVYDLDSGDPDAEERDEIMTG